MGLPEEDRDLDWGLRPGLRGQSTRIGAVSPSLAEAATVCRELAVLCCIYGDLPYLQ